MQIAKFSEIKQRLHIEEDEIYFYAASADGTITLRKANEYLLQAEAGLKEIYGDEPDGLWEKCLDD